MNTQIFDSKEEMGAAAAQAGAERLGEVLRDRGEASIIVATGASQFEMLSSLSKSGLHWPSVTGFRLDEYIGISIPMTPLSGSICGSGSSVSCRFR